MRGAVTVTWGTCEMGVLSSSVSSGLEGGKDLKSRLPLEQGPPPARGVGP